MNKSEIRELAFQFLYSTEILNEKTEEQLQLFIDNNEITNTQALKYIPKVVNGINNHNEEILKMISENLKEGWTINRLSKIDLVLLKLAIYEIKYNNIPYQVEVNEVVELAKKYGTDTSKSFVNGVLASIIRKVASPHV